MNWHYRNQRASFSSTQITSLIDNFLHILILKIFGGSPLNWVVMIVYFCYCQVPSTGSNNFRDLFAFCVFSFEDFFFSFFFFLFLLLDSFNLTNLFNKIVHHYAYSDVTEPRTISPISHLKPFFSDTTQQYF